MTLGQLMEMQTQGALNIKHEGNSDVAVLGGVTITKEQAQMICSQLGWLENYVNPFEAINRTNQFLRGMKNLKFNDYIMANTMIEFQNKRSNTYGKSYDRVHMMCPNLFEISVIHGMENIGAAFVAYDSRTSAPVAKCRTWGNIADYILTLN